MNTLIQRREALRRRCAGSFDIVFRDITVDALQGTMVFLSSLTDARLLSAISESFVISAANTLQLTLYPAAVEAIYEEETAMVSLLSGQCLVLLEGHAPYYCVEVRSYPSRPNSEPNVERSVRGAHDGFVENIIFNVGLIRRRIRHNHSRLHRSAYSTFAGSLLWLPRAFLLLLR